MENFIIIKILISLTFVALFSERACVNISDQYVKTNTYVCKYIFMFTYI